MFGFQKTPRTLIVGVAAILLATAAGAWWLLKESDVILFNRLDQAQLNSISADLDRAHIRYRIDREQQAIAVSMQDEARARMTIMSSGNAFREAVGFELFNNSDFGMTDFAQKINYQRAIEGELSRTISALAEIKYARVHLVLPEHGLFQAEKQSARAAITIFPEQGVVLDSAQVRGIQRLTAAAVPELQEKDVTVVDQSGVVLSVAAMDEDVAAVGGRLAQRQALERYLGDKARAVLTKALGAERFAVSVDATLDLSQKTTTTERVLENPAGTGIKRIKETSRGVKGDDGDEDRLKEVDYALGREVEQITHATGSIRRLQVGVIVDRDLANVDVEKLRELVAAAVGFDAKRDDKVTVVQHGVAVQRMLEHIQQPVPPNKSPSTEKVSASLNTSWMWIVGGAILIAGVFVSAMNRSAAKKRELLRRQELREQLRLWVQSETSAAEQV